VHAIDDGTFEHFLKWLGYGMWPWVMFMPVTLVLAARVRLADRTPKSRLRLFLFLWFFIAYTLFTLSSTKFHHYIFPALPPLALLIGWTVIDLLRDRTWLARTAIAVAIGLFGLLGWDLYHNPQHLRNQFTYKYDRELPLEEERPIDADAPIVFHPTDATDWEPDKTWSEGEFYKHTPAGLHTVLNASFLRYEPWILAVGGVVLFGLLLMVFMGSRRVGLALIAMSGVAMTMWALNYYMPMLGPHWSQKYLFDRYYDVCVTAKNSPQITESFTPLIAEDEALTQFFSPRGKQVCEEEVISWLLTWRGETFYSNNAIRPIQKENKQFQPYLKEISKGARFFVHIERTRAKGFKSRMDSHLKKLTANKHYKGIEEYAVTLEHNENYWFVLLKADPVCKKGYAKDKVGRCLRTKETAAR